jgi:nitrate reductase NapAB chaperone NapD
VKEPKKQQIVNVMQAIEQTPPSALATTGAKAKVVVAIETKDAGEAEATMSDIDKIISEVVKDVTVEEDVATAPDKERGIDSGPSGKEDFDLRLLGGQELSE